MTCSLPPVDEQDHEFLHVHLHEQCSVSLDPEMRAVLFLLHGDLPTLGDEPLCGIAFDEKSLTQMMLQLREIMKRLRTLPRPKGNDA